MALKDCTWSESRNYRNGSEAEPLEFFLNGLTNSTSLSLLLGYFSSTAISHLAYGFAHFISNGGKVRIVLNQILSPEDKIAIQNSENIKSEIPFDLSDFSSLERVLNKYDKHFFECLSYLISQKRIEFKIIKPLNGRGISHYKSGVFEDGEDKVCYEASCNFTYFGLNRNLERLTSFLSWEGNRSKLQCKETLDLINGYFNESEKNVQYLDTENIQEAIYQQFGSKDINELVVQEKEFIQQKSRSNLKYKISKLLEKVMDGGGQGVKPSFPYSTGPRDYQLEAYEQWMNSGKIGLFNMATGTGKTITALNCLLKESQETGLYKAIILVPTNTLANQWQTEVSDKFNFKEVYFCNSTNRVWKEELKHLGDLVWLGRNPNYVIITTYETFKGELFQNIFKEKFYSDYSSQLLIADEAHAMGSIGFLKVIPEYITRRIGLSATPFRQYDEVGNDKINNYFNITDSQYTYEYNMKKAINNGVLSQYYYYPKIVSLTSEEHGGLPSRM